MKRMFISAFVMLLCISTTPAFAVDKATLREKVANMTEEQKEARYIQMKQRVEEIKNMDRSTLTKEEKRDLKNELKDMNKEAKAAGKSGIYISTAGIIIIILLLIILL